jgi:hypothetical protein
MAIVEIDGDAETVTKEIPMKDWFDEIVESEKESKDEGSNSEDALVDVFDRDTSGGALVKERMVVSGTDTCMRIVLEDSGITGLLWPCYDDIKGTGMLPSTLLGLITLVADLKGECEGGGIIGKLSGLGPDLNMFRNPWIKDTMMEWSNHASAL